jgi:hypothetical protein
LDWQVISTRPSAMWKTFCLTMMLCQRIDRMAGILPP